MNQGLEVSLASLLGLVAAAWRVSENRVEPTAWEKVTRALAAIGLAR